METVIILLMLSGLIIDKEETLVLLEHKRKVQSKVKLKGMNKNVKDTKIIIWQIPKRNVIEFHNTEYNIEIHFKQLN